MAQPPPQEDGMPTGADDHHRTSSTTALLTNDVYDTYKPPGFHTVSSYISVTNPEALVEFLTTAFFAVELQRTVDDENDGALRNCILQLGDSCFMVSPASPPFTPMPGQFYLYVKDPHFMVERAVQHGATRIMEVSDMSYGDRQGGVRDVQGNIWWISKRIIEEPYQNH